MCAKVWRWVCEVRCLQFPLEYLQRWRRTVANCSRSVLPWLEKHDHQSLSASIAEWPALRRVQTGTVVQYHAGSKKRALPNGTVVQYHAGSKKRALPNGTLFSPPELVTNGGRGVTELRDRTSEPSRSVARRRVVRTEVNWATRWADRQGWRFRSPDASKQWKRAATAANSSFSYLTKWVNVAQLCCVDYSTMSTVF